MSIEELYAEIGTDYEVVSERFCNLKSLLMKFVKSFPDDKTYGKLVDAINESNYVEVECQAHTLKGVSANLGFDNLQNTCAAVVSCVRDGRTESISECFMKVRDEYESVIDKIKMLD